MKLYQINVTCTKGSTGRIIKNIADIITSKGGECRVAFGRGNESEYPNSYRCVSTVGKYYHALMARITGKQGLYSNKETLRLIEDIKRFSPDIIQLHNIHGYYLNYKILFEFLKQYNRPVVWTLHDCWSFTGHCAHYEKIGCQKWIEGCINCQALDVYPKTITGKNIESNYFAKKEAFTGLKNLTLITPSLWLKQQVEYSFMKDYPVKVINNGILLDKFHVIDDLAMFDKDPFIGKKLLLGVTSVWSKEKGLDDFVTLREMLDDNYLVCLVGLSDKQISQYKDKILCIKKTESMEELSAYYSRADVFLNLTYEDTFPTTNIEALACGTPIITYKTGGSPEIVEEGCGAVVEKGDLQGVVNQVVKICGDRKPVDNCLNASKKYDAIDKFGEYVDIYNELLNKNR